MGFKHDKNEPYGTTSHKRQVELHMEQVRQGHKGHLQPQRRQKQFAFNYKNKKPLGTEHSNKSQEAGGAACGMGETKWQTTPATELCNY